MTDQTKAARGSDVVVYGATASGVVAAVATARLGRTVSLLDPGRHLGGMLSGGLSHSDVLGQEKLIGGIALEVYQRIAAHYGLDEAAEAFDFEPHVAELVLGQMVEEAGVSVFFGEQLQRVEKANGRITALLTTHGRFEGRVFIDAGYEGDVMAAAGVSYIVGRESRGKYDETLAGRMELLPGEHQFRAAVSPWDGDQLLPYVNPQTSLVPTCEGDGKFQSYCYRLCLTDREENRLPIEQPEGYDESDYELLRRYIVATGESPRRPIGLSALPNGKFDVNSGGPVSTNLLGAQLAYPEATPEERQRIAEIHQGWAQGLLWFLQHHPDVPTSLQVRMQQLGLCRDEFPDSGGWPHQLYVREGRRLVGSYVVTQHDLQESRTKPDSIGMCGYNIDIREVQWVSVRNFHFPKAADEVFMEGYVSQPVDPWQIPYRALIPQKSECENLIVSVCASMSTIAFASFRMEAGYMIAGHAAGSAAALCCSAHQAVQDIDIDLLQRHLRQQKQHLCT